MGRPVLRRLQPHDVRGGLEVSQQMSTFEVSYNNLIPDGISTIVKLQVKTEFAVATSNAATEAEDILVHLVARITGHPEDQIRQELEADKWLGKGWAPEERNV